MKKFISLASVALALTANAQVYQIYPNTADAVHTEVYDWYGLNRTIVEDATVPGGSYNHIETWANNGWSGYGYLLPAENELTKYMNADNDIVFEIRSTDTFVAKVKPTVEGVYGIEPEIQFDRDGEWHTIRLNYAKAFGELVQKATEFPTNSGYLFSFVTGNTPEVCTVDIANIRIEPAYVAPWEAGKIYTGEASGICSQFGNEIPYTVKYNFETIEDKQIRMTVTFDMGEVVGIVAPQVHSDTNTNINWLPMEAIGDNGNSYSVVLNPGLDTGDTLNLFIYRPYAEGAIRIDILYVVGSENNVPSIVTSAVASENLVDVYTLQGVRVLNNVKAAEAIKTLPAGLYVVGGKKVLVK